MATTSLSLGPHWDTFIKTEVKSGKYGSASEVVRDALRTLEARNLKLKLLETHLAEGANQAANGDIIENFQMDQFIGELDS
jgi:antitoxin ParD1/3/4